MEAIKVLAGLGEPLYGKILLCDLRDMSFRRATLRRNTACAVCPMPLAALGPDAG